MRDHRIDVVRGAALLIILWNHLARSLPRAYALTELTPAVWGLSDAADVFVFLSGYVYGLAYARVWERGGLRAVYKKSAVRAWELYVVNAVAFVLAAGLVAAFALHVAPEQTAAIETFAPLLERPLDVLASFPALRADVPYFDVLVLYIEILLVVPVLYALVRFRWWVGLGASAVLYLVGQTEGGEWPLFFNPLAWQLLFVAAVALGVHRPQIPRTKGWALAAVVVVGSALSFRVLHPLALRGFVPDLGWTAVVEWSAKGTLGVGRLVHFAALAYLFHYVTRRHSPVWAGRWVAPLRMAGRHSLGVFAFGIVLTYAGTLVGYTAGTGLVGGALIAGAACVASLVFAHVLEWRSARPARASATPLSQSGPAALA